MAVKKDIKSDLTLEIDGNSVTPDKFIRSVRSFFAIVREVSAHVSGRETGVEWRVQVSEGSNLVSAIPSPGQNPAIVAEITRALSDGIGSLESRAARPRFFSERAISSLRELASVVGSTEKDDTSVRVWVRREPIKLTHKSVAHASELLNAAHEDHGSIEGRLRAVTDKGGIHFVVKEPVTGTEIRCFIPEHLTEVALANFRNRVEVYGLIKYRKDGRPVSMSVDDIVPFPPKEELPSYLDVRGILREAS